MTDFNALTAEELEQLSGYVVAIENRMVNGVPTADQRRLVKLWNYLQVVRRRNVNLGIAYADAEKRIEYAQHEAWEAAIESGDLVDNPYDARPTGDGK